jgi:hypothetical protein
MKLSWKMIGHPSLVTCKIGIHGSLLSIFALHTELLKRRRVGVGGGEAKVDKSVCFLQHIQYNLCTRVLSKLPEGTFITKYYCDKDIQTEY